MKSFHEKTAVAARGKWRGILMHIGVPESFLSKGPLKHGPCPFCGGKDRFRYDDKEGAGTWFCNQCGAGGGIEFVMRFTGEQFADAASRIDGILGNVPADSSQPKREPTLEERRNACMAVWRETKKVEPGDLIHTYLAERGLGEIECPVNLRLHPALRDGEGGIRPAMIARVTASDGSGATLHRTFLRPDGRAKAEMASPRKLMPGPIPDGAAIRLGPENAVIGIAEGIETALAASVMFSLPVWAAVTATMLEKWEPPANAEEVFIFGDADANYHGQSAAYNLARRLCRDRPALTVEVRLPDDPGTDWNDILLRQRRSAA